MQHRLILNYLKMKIKLLLLTGSLIALASAPVFGGTLSFSGTTTGGNLFNRPTEAADSLSDVGTAVPYLFQAFTVGTTGNYNFTTIAGAPASYDTFVHLYSGSFNAAFPLLNLVSANDDLVGGNSNAGSGFVNQPLTSGNPYVYVINGFGNSDFGSFSSSITGPGSIAAVPEPSTIAIAGLALGGFVLIRRRHPSIA
ncbi:MAG: motif putative anchor domain protein [Verrucomicrobiales bacterium]|nr:motif putative anchor domain protein [Verrucomicrobiales bacterium]